MYRMKLCASDEVGYVHPPYVSPLDGYDESSSEEEEGRTDNLPQVSEEEKLFLQRQGTWLSLF